MNLLTFDPAKAPPADLRAAQTPLADLHFYPREKIDGENGPMTRRALAGYAAATTGDLADVAASQIGATEDPAGSNSGAVVRMYQAAATDEGGTGWAWCAAFVCWCIARWFASSPRAPRGIKLPTTASAFEFEDWGRKVGAKILRPGVKGFSVQRGDIVIYTFSHIGIAGAQDGSGTLHVIEGNTNDDGGREGFKVINHPRYVAKVKCIVRLPA